MRKVVLLFLFLPALSWAEYTPAVVISKVSVVLDRGFRVTGNFGTPLTCELENQIFIDINHPQYDQIYSMALASFASKSQIRFEVRKCSNVGWISSKSIATLDASSTGEVDITN